MMGLLDAQAPDFWVDADGKRWRTSRVIGRLRFEHGGAWALRLFVYRRDKYACQHCGWAADLADPSWDGSGRSPLGMTGDLRECLILDHIISRCRGGSHHPDNLQCLCSPCNAKKGWRQ